MAGTAAKTDPKLWERVKAKVVAGDKGGRPGQWSARKAQLAVQSYKAAGGTYEGRKSADNHLVQWGKEEWGTKSGRTSQDSGERYLPKKARRALSSAEYRRTSAKKRRDTQAGKQFSKQPRDVARKTAPYRTPSRKAPALGNGASSKSKPAAGTRAALYAEARRRGIPGCSHLNREQLSRVLARAAR